MPYIFISYSHEDSEYANRLAYSLEAKGLDTWIDERIDHGARWPQVIQEQVDGCAAFAVVMTPDSFESEWVQNELARARRLDKTTFPLLLEGDVWLALEATHYVDVRGGKLPPARFYDELAGVLSAGQTPAFVTSQPESLQTELDKLQRRNDNLTSRIAAVDSDLAREMDGERRLTLENRRAELAAKRGDVVARMAQIETQLAEREEGKQGVRQPPDQKVAPPAAEVAPDESKPKPEVQVRQRARGGPWRLVTGLVVVVAAIAVIVFVRTIMLPRPIQPTAPIVTPLAKDDAVILAGDIMTVTSPVKMELVRVPAGEFWMGSDPAKDSQASDDEQPRHRVDLPEYYIGKYEVTNAQYETFLRFVRATRQEVPSYWGIGRIPPEKGNHPVVNVTWDGAEAFTKWLSASTGLACRLPTEAEWEKTCRGTEGLIYPWGDSGPDIGKGNFNNNVGDTTRVGSYPPKADSPYGAVDMAGNVWEWTNSVYEPYPYSSTDSREAWTVLGSHEVRGGSFGRGDWHVRCAARDYFSSDDHYGDLGFRVVCVSPPS